MDVVIIAGGLGTRLANRTNGLPKALVNVCGVPLLEHHIALAARHGASRVFVLTGYGSDAIGQFCGDGSRWGVGIECIAEAQPLGTAGAVLAALDRLPERFVVTYGDTFLNVDLSRMIDSHLQSGAEATLLLHPNDHPADSDLVEIDPQSRILAFHPYPHPADALLPNLVNGALYVLERDSLRHYPVSRLPFDFGKHLFPEMIRAGARLHGYRSTEYIKDAGTPERLDQVERDFASGVVARASLAQPQPAVFMDRDGVLNKHDGYVTTPTQLVLLPGAADGLRQLREAGLRIVVVTNQPVIARGICTEAGLALIHNKLEMDLGKQGAFVDAIYYCPHHPDKGFAGERADLKIRCDCRKPATGMVEKATADLNIALERSWMIGNSTADMELARRVRLRSILVETGEGGRDGKHRCHPDFVFPSLGEAAKFIAVGFPALLSHLGGVADSIDGGSVVLIGGQAGSGKSTAAAVLRVALKERGLRAVIVPLDSWIRSIAERSPNDRFTERHDFSSASAAVEAMRHNPGTHRFSRYDRAARSQIADDMQIEIDPDSILIVEGVSALVNPGLLRIATTRIAVSCSESIRQSRLRRVYRGNGFTDDEIDRVLADRTADEVPVVEGGQRRADLMLDLEFAKPI